MHFECVIVYVVICNLPLIWETTKRGIMAVYRFNGVLVKYNDHAVFHLFDMCFPVFPKATIDVQTPFHTRFVLVLFTFYVF